MRGVKFCGWGVLILGLMAGAAPARQSAAPAHGRERIGSWGPGAWSWFADPRAVQVGDQTFVGWIDWQGRITVGQYDPDRRARVKFRYAVGRLRRDDHSSPSILVRPDRRLTVFWSGHGGSAIYYRTTARPAEIHSWGPVHQVPRLTRWWLGFTYPTPVSLASERKLYLFYRGAKWGIDYSTLRWGGRWTRDRTLVSNPGQRPYVKLTSNNRDEIAFAFNQAHPRDQLTNVYYMAYRKGWLRHADGKAIRRLSRGPASPRDADLVYDARRTGAPSWVWDIALRPDGRPVITYATFPADGRHLYWYATWTGHRWLSHFLTVAGPSISPDTIEFEYVGGIVIDHADPATVYLSRKVRGWFEIERWTTRDGGFHWRHTVVVRTPGQDDIRPFFTEGSRGGPMSLLWLAGGYGSYTTYRTSVDYLR
ncbi:MAG TPA: BNR-4 repeat-containing protein [Solirubrobacteraceae bacterium]|nr:BNR-4 repeat-containing protein [Solirubrobacteraceae bacterium]